MKRLILVAVLAATVVSPQLAIAQDGAAAVYRRSYALEAKSDLVGALSAMDDLARLGASDYVYWLRRGWLNYLAGKSADAVIAYRRAVDLAPGAVEPKLGLMLPLMALRRWHEAERAGEDVLVLAPGDFTARSRLAWIRYTQARYTEAETDYRKALFAYPANVEMRAGLAWTLLKLDRAADARIEFERILAVAPDHASAKDGMAALAAVASH